MLILSYYLLPLLALVSAASIVILVRRLIIPPPARSFDLVSFDITRIADREYEEQFLDAYFSKLTEYVNKATKSIYVLDYLAHHRSLNVGQSKSVVFRYEEYFRIIEKRVRERGLEYRRTLQLPLDQNKADRPAILGECVSLMFAETLSHIKRMLESGSDFRLYVLGAAIRPYSYMIVDNKYLITEYDRYNNRGISIGDHLIINSIIGSSGVDNKEVAQLIDTHNSWMARLLKKQAAVTLEEIVEATNSLEEMELREIEVRLALDRESLQEIFGSQKRFGVVRDLRPYTQEEVHSSSRGTAKKRAIFQS